MGVGTTCLGAKELELENLSIEKEPNIMRYSLSWCGFSIAITVAAAGRFNAAKLLLYGALPFSAKLKSKR